MDKKLPGIFVNKIDKKLTNNNDVYYSKEDKEKSTIKNSKELNISKTINQKIKEIFAGTDYIYKADVEITYNNKTVTKRIVGHNNKNIITYDNELIPIDKITDIRRVS